ncbi:MAG: Hpt domain-containing protein [Oscillospiraceae bacterium]|nr:Hpt domain-containing protein [Oscillospiraceae bacterium]
MLTIDALRRLGANTEEGLGRCMKNEAFYLRLVNMALDDEGYDKLVSAIDHGDLKAAFEVAHSLKGSLGNLALTPIYAPIAELTESLRGGQETGCRALLDQILQARAALLALREN